MIYFFLFFISFLFISLLLFRWINDRSSTWFYITTGNWYFLIVDLFWTWLDRFYILCVFLFPLVKWTLQWIDFAITYWYLIIFFLYFLWRTVVDYFFPRFLKINWDHRCTLTFFGFWLTERSLSDFWFFFIILDSTGRPPWIFRTSYKLSGISSSDSHYIFINIVQRNHISRQQHHNYSHNCATTCGFIFLFGWICLCRHQHVIVVRSAWVAYW